MYSIINLVTVAPFKLYANAVVEARGSDKRLVVLLPRTCYMSTNTSEEEWCPVLNSAIFDFRVCSWAEIYRDLLCRCLADCRSRK